METFAKSDTKVSTGILHLRKKELLINDISNDYKIMMACVDSIGWDSKLNKKENQLIDLVEVYKKEFSKHKKGLDIYFKNGYYSPDVHDIVKNNLINKNQQMSMFD